MEKLSYKLETFEGPLDLLLYLITKNKLDICDIQISELLDQYMEQINAMQEADMDIASEFLEMAARLVYMKTVSLLPKHEEMEALRQELTGQLLEYQECKQVAAQLTERFNYNIYVREPAEVELDKSYKRHHDPREILAAYLSAAGRGKRVLPPSPQSFSGIVTHRIVSVTSQIVYVLRRLWKVKSIAYESLFVEKREKSDLVATFLAVLELVKGKRVRIEGEGEAATVNLMDGGERHWKSKRSEEQ
ncbi:segregation and condensation protein A [Anaeromassilibacillus sp. SJQ-1]|uniref:segregation and condensation protein A n=1 Tax=Anaeromassilibacillus sp. SJQ-1 TaxID=3375419 RepID=UPI0039899F43